MKKNQTYFLKDIMEAVKSEELDDDLFVSVCEFLGNDELKRIQECIYSDNIDSVRAGIIKFKKALSTVAKNKIKALSKYA